MDYLAESKRLNSAQRLAVEAIEGPVMVIAGPGTGKTQVLAMRVGRILEKTQANPSNILCLTFSLAGAKAMRERLRALIGPSAYGVTVNTIHGFCNDLILQYPQIFEDFRASEHVSDLSSLRIVRKAIHDLGSGSQLGRLSGGEKDRASDVLAAIHELKREGVSPENIESILAQYEEELMTTKGGKARKEGSKVLEDAKRKLKQLQEFIVVYRTYQKVLTDTHRFDTDDMILIALQALREHEWVRVILQERYQYVLIDEFQDLSGSQNAVIDALLTYVGVDFDPNVFVVGDDDQAIYRFQGASIGSMLEFLRKYPKAQVITLTENYRSVQPILDTATTLISANTERLASKVPGVTKELHSTVKGEKEKPMFLRVPSTEVQYASIVEALKVRHKEGVSWSAMAVLCRRNSEVLEIAEVLSAAKIPAIITAKDHLLLHESVREIFALLKVIEAPQENAVLSSALACPCFQLSPAILGKLWFAFREARRSDTEKGSLLDFILRNRGGQEASLLKVIDTLQCWRGLAGRATLPQLLEDVLKTSGLLPVSEQGIDAHALAGIQAFYDYVKRRCYEEKTLTLTGLLADLTEYEREPKLTLEYDVPHLIADGVQLMTAHGAKGLEFDTVCIPNLRYRNWGDRMERTNIALPRHLLLPHRTSDAQTGQEDERRLLFVALTRAKQELVLLTSETYRSGDDLKEAQVSSFIADVKDSVSEEVPSVIPHPINVLLRPTMDIDAGLQAFLTERLQDFALSVTALNAFLEDPQAFLLEHLLCMPKAKAAHLAYGSAVHAALERRNLAWKEGKEFTLEELLATFRETMQRRELLTEREREEYLARGLGVLQKYGVQTQSAANVLYAEKSFSARLGDIPITGKVDRIDALDETGSTVRIVDYKTGVPKRTLAAVKEDEGLYRQLVFYKLLTAHTKGFLPEAKVFALDFIGTDREERSFIECEIAEAEVAELTKLIEVVWKKICAFDFTPIEK